MQNRCGHTRRVPVKNNHPRCHWTRGRHGWKPKKAYTSVAEALAYIKRHKMWNYSAYTCRICGAIHIGVAIDKEND